MKNIEKNREGWVNWMTSGSPFITRDSEKMDIEIVYEIERGSLIKLREEETSVDGFYAIDMETGGYKEFLLVEKEQPFIYMGSVKYTEQMFRLHLFLYDSTICGLRSERSITDGVWGIEKLE